MGEMKYCMECGTALEKRLCGDEGLVPYCPKCEQFRFPVFNCAIITAVLNPEKNKILLIKQYGRPFYILVAGYVNKGENAEHALYREVQEELGLDVTAHHFMRSQYFEGSNTLMLNFACVADSEDLSGMTKEVDSAKWFTFEEALKNIKQGSLAHFFLRFIVEQLESPQGMTFLPGTGTVYSEPYHM